MELLLRGREVLLGVSGGIAAYKSAELVRMLKGSGAVVNVVMTDAATRFVSPLTFSALTGRSTHTGLFDGGSSGPIAHIELTAGADLFIVAPATANIIGKAANGIADDLLSTMLLAAKCPVLFAPAMNCRMYDNHAVQRNIETLKNDGVLFVGPEEGPMACEEYGWGRMSEPTAILDAAVSVLARPGDLAGRNVLVTAGPTIEDIDPVRYISNRSTGMMGYAVAAEAVSRGADVFLVSGPTSIRPPAGVHTTMVRSAAEMEREVMAAADDADIIIMCAAVADYSPSQLSAAKIKKGPEDFSLKLVMTTDILKSLGRVKRRGQLLVGFAAETNSLEENAVKKLVEKNLDLIAANPVGGDTGFGSRYNILKVYDRVGLVADTGKVTKEQAAQVLLDCVSKSMLLSRA